MKITLIYPGFCRIGFNSLGKGGMVTNWINLGLAYIGAYLKKNGHTVDLLDLREMKDWGSVECEMKLKNPDLFGIYFNTSDADAALRCSEIAHKLKKKVVAGGPHASIVPQELINTGSVDYVIVGEGEKAFLRLIDILVKGGKPEKIIQGEIIQDLDELPFPDRELYNLKKVLHPKGNFPFLDNGLILMASRGCPYNCSFCQPLVKKMFGSKMRCRSVENVISEIKYILDRYKVKYISFQDDTFTVRKDWVLKLCRRMKEEKIKVQWSAQSRVNLFDEELASAMSGAGCVCVFFGFESGSQRVLDFYRKGITPEQSRKAARICKKYGMLIFADYIFGAPGETEAELKMTVEMMKEIRPEIPSPTYLTPVPGCDLYEVCRSQGLLNINSFKDFDRNPWGEKIKGINYKMLEGYKNETLAFAPLWFEEKHFAKLVIQRWFNLLKCGCFIELLKEIIVMSLSYKNRKSPFCIAARDFYRKLFK